MSTLSRAKTRARAASSALAFLLLVAFVVLVPLSARAQPYAPAAARVTPRPRQTPKAADPFSAAMVPWFSLDPVGAGLIRGTGAGRPLDLAARQQDDTDIIVYGRHKAVDPRSDREHDFSAPGWSDLVTPRSIPIGPASSCSSGAYRTIGGQPATGMDLVGGLGGGRC